LEIAVMRFLHHDVALKIDMKISALAGSAINGMPVLANQAWAGVVTIPQNQAVPLWH
jgi:hypothetical protein